MKNKNHTQNQPQHAPTVLRNEDDITIIPSHQSVLAKLCDVLSGKDIEAEVVEERVQIESGDFGLACLEWCDQDSELHLTGHLFLSNTKTQEERNALLNKLNQASGPVRFCQSGADDIIHVCTHYLVGSEGLCKTTMTHLLERFKVEFSCAENALWAEGFFDDSDDAAGDAFTKSATFTRRTDYDKQSTAALNGKVGA